MNIKQFLVKFDWMLLLTSITLSLIGFISIYSGNFSNNLKTNHIQQLVYIFIGIVIVFIVSNINISFLLNYSFFIYLGGLILLLLTLFFGETVNASRSWIDLGFISFQPSEFIKLFIILYTAFYYGRKEKTHIKDVFISFIFFIPSVILVLLQPDLGTALVLVFIWFVITMTTNLKLRYKAFIVIFATISLLVAFSLVYFDVVEIPSYQMERMRVFPDHLLLREGHHSGIGYQVDQSLIAVGTGGLLGKGLGKGLQTQLDFLPEPETDFIFSSMSEELGVIGVLIILSLYVFLIWKIYMISTLNLSSAIYFIIVGIICMISFHVIQNIGMNIGLLPVTGIPMPFISAGGSFLVVCFASIALVEGIYLNLKK